MSDSVKLFYIQNKGHVGNCAIWWREGGSGYTCNLDEAWKVPEDQAKSICRTRRGEDVMWPAGVVDASAQRHVDCQRFRK